MTPNPAKPSVVCPRCPTCNGEGGTVEFDCPDCHGSGRIAQPEQVASSPHRGTRCGLCYWALYDGDWCQNKACSLHGKSVGDQRIHLTNDEAQVLIASDWQPISTAPKDGTEIITAAKGIENSVGASYWDWREKDFRDCRTHELIITTHWQPLPPPPQ